MILRTAFDTFAPPANYYFRSSLSTYSAIAIYFIAGCHGAFQTRKTSAGVLVALTSHVIGLLIGICFEVGLFFVVISRDTRQFFNEFQDSGGWGEVWVCR